MARRNTHILAGADLIATREKGRNDQPSPRTIAGEGDSDVWMAADQFTIGRDDIIDGRREAMLRREAVIEHNHSSAALLGDFGPQMPMRIQPTDRIATAMERARPW